MSGAPAIELRGRARVLGDGINTDYIISSSRKKRTIDPRVLKQWLLETVDPGFAASIEPGDIIVAGDAFGCGSAMEVAVTVVLAAGIRAVIARGFSRSYLRNAINNGLVPLECEAGGVREGDPLHIVVSPGRAVIENLRDGSILEAAPLPDFVLRIVLAGGLVPYLREHAGSFGVT